jgi:hypothetical protein
MALAFTGSPPDAAELSRQWHEMLREARDLIAVLPPVETGKCVLDPQGNLFRGSPAQLRDALPSAAVRFHEGSIRGALPRLEV